jgi:calcium-dependent protein kinase
MAFDFNKFKKFACHNKIKQAAITCVALNNSNGLVFDLIGLFKEIDKNGDGVITLEEITSYTKEKNIKLD